MVTSSYKNFDSDLYYCYSISGDGGKNARYTGKKYPQLAPKITFWKKWNDNKGKVSEEENNKYYVEEYYKEVLSKLDPEEVYGVLKHRVLLCYEDSAEFCHRHIVAEWLNILLNIDVPEVKCVNGELEPVERPKYIRDYLEEAMRKNLNMHGYNSLRAQYLFEESQRIKQEADNLEKKFGRSFEGYRQAASFLDYKANEEERKYNNQRQPKIKLKEIGK